MDIITSHNSLDFDGLASMVAASKLFPAAIPVIPGTLSKNVRQFMGIYKDSLVFRTPNEIDLDAVERVILVDTRNLARLGSLKGLEEKDCEYIVFDHHPDGPGDISGIVNEVHMVGAATTILVEKIRQEDILITPFEATILALGIYEDTGSLLFTSTADRDAEAVAYLLRQGANLSVVASFVEEPFSSEQRHLLQKLLANVKRYRINGLDIVMASGVEKGFISGLDVVTHHLLEVEVCDAIFVVVVMQGKAQVVARSRTSSILVNKILSSLGGHGHEKAASAVIKQPDLEEIENAILQELKENSRTGLSARDIMSSPVKSLSADVTMDEAGKTMLRYGHTGMPVVDGDRLVGIISRRDVDKARIHNLGHAPVKGFMTRDVVTVSPDTGVNEIWRIVVERDIGRVPVVDDGRLIGIVSRTDLLRTMHGDQYPEDHSVLHTGSELEIISDHRETLEVRLPKRIKDILKTAGMIADGMGVRVYCVGGFVRDLLMNVRNFDVDLVVEGDGMEFAGKLAAELGGRARLHERFRTAVVLLPDRFKIDVATARTEYYEFPAALPRVEKSSIKEDMYRRDFTINTMAICLNGDQYGKMFDYFGGQRDLEQGLIRILYNLSFVEDPTRIIRAIRFEARFKFCIEPDTLQLARSAIQRRLLKQLSYKRIRQELQLILEEKDPLPALRRMEEIGVWQYVLPEVVINDRMRYNLRRVPRVLGWLAERELDRGVRPWVVYMQVLCSRLEQSKLLTVVNRFHFDRETERSLSRIQDMIDFARDFQQQERMPFSQLDQILQGYSMENVVFFLLCLDQEWAWEKAVRYLELAQNVKVALNGHDLKRMGIPPGPIFKILLDRLRAARLDGRATSYQDEVELVRKWMEDSSC
ncbi:MAG: CBS domain-containing protein [Bacillota bacterium]